MGFGMGVGSVEYRGAEILKKARESLAREWGAGAVLAGEGCEDAQRSEEGGGGGGAEGDRGGIQEVEPGLVGVVGVVGSVCDGVREEEGGVALLVEKLLWGHGFFLRGVESGG